LQSEDLLSAAQDGQPARLRVCGKGRQERIVLLSGDAAAVVQVWLQEHPVTPDPHLFLNERGRSLTSSGIEWLLREYGQQIDLHVTPHQLRHTYARQLTDAGMPLPSLSKLMGHAQITTTQIYTAGADPKLAAAYPAASARLAEPAPTSTREAPSAPPALGETAAPAAPALPDWEAWAPHLPAPLRHASLDFVQSRLYTWPAPRRRQRALSLLNDLEHLWDWFLARRPVTQPGELHLKDLWAYQSDQQARGYAASTINSRLGLRPGPLTPAGRT
jgi:hypothetical protein